MPWEAWLTIAVTVTVLVLLAREWLAPDMAFLGAIILLAICKVITPAQAFAGFTNPAVLLVAALFVVAAGLRETGVMDALGQRFLSPVRTEFGALVWIAAVTLVTSAFMNNTPIVAMLIPVVMSWCRKHQVAPSKLLIPLSFLTILGGCCTLIGTSTNLVIQGKMLENGLPRMGFFEIAWAGVPCALVGTIYMLTIGRKLLPERTELLDQLRRSQREYLVELVVQAGCRLIGQTIEQAGLRQLPGLFLIEIDRRGTVMGPVSPDAVIEIEDRLIFTGAVATIVDLKKIAGLVPAEDTAYDVSAPMRTQRRLSEAVVSRSSPLIGRTVRDSNFRTQYNAVIVAVHRNGERLTGKVGDLTLQAGDTLLLQTGPHFTKTHRNNPDFYLVSDVEDSQALRHENWWVALFAFAVLVVVMVWGVTEPMLAAFAIGLFMIGTRCLSASDARQSVEWPVLVSIGASFGLGTALEKSGAADYLSGLLVNAVQPLGPTALMAAIYLMTMMLNELITNNGAAAIAFPFCLAAAKLTDCSERPFLMAATLAASFAFASPIGYQTHMMVYGPGGYRFNDFVRVGLPLNILLWIVATIVIPIVWPF